MIIIQCDKCDLRITVNQYLNHENGSVIIDIHNEKETKVIKESIVGQDYINGMPMQFCKTHSDELQVIKNEANSQRDREVEKWAEKKP